MNLHWFLLVSGCFDGAHLALVVRLVGERPDHAWLVAGNLITVIHWWNTVSIHSTLKGALALCHLTFHSLESNKNSAQCYFSTSMWITWNTENVKHKTITMLGAVTTEKGGANVGSLWLDFSPLGLFGQVEGLICCSQTPEVLIYLPPAVLVDWVRLFCTLV